MKKLSLLFCVFCVLAIIILACEKDDICAEETPTTPQLILRLYDLANPDETSNVPDLFAYGLDENDEIISFLGIVTSTTDSLAIPLRTDQDQTRFVLHQNYEIDDNNVLGNPDVITVNYIREDVYVSRACGFKTIFNTITFSVGIDLDNWIVNSEIIIPNVDNEISAHVKIYH